MVLSTALSTRSAEQIRSDLSATSQVDNPQIVRYSSSKLGIWVGRLRIRSVPNYNTKISLVDNFGRPFPSNTTTEYPSLDTLLNVAKCVTVIFV